MSENVMGNGQTEGSGDSSGINELRKQNRDLAKRVAEAEQVRANAAESMLTAKGFGKLASIYLNQTEGFPTEESVEGFLADLGLNANEEKVPEPEPEAEPEKKSASELGQQVASAADGDEAFDLDRALADATSAEQIDQIMRDAGLAV